MLRSVPRPAWFFAIGLVVLAYLDHILAYVADQATRVTGTLQHYSGRIAVGAALIGITVHLLGLQSEHGWKLVERAAIFVFGVALIPVLFPHIQTLAGGPVPHVINLILNALVNGLAGIGG